MTFATARARIGTVLGVVLLTTVVASCASKPDSDTATEAGSGSASASAPVTASATPLPAAPSSSSAAISADGCPVTAATLLAVFNANRDLARTIVLGAGLDEVTCYRGYATARTTPDVTQADPATILFRYSPNSGRWTAVTGGTDVPCGDFDVPAMIAARLPRCSPG